MEQHTNTEPGLLKPLLYWVFFIDKLNLNWYADPFVAASSKNVVLYCVNNLPLEQGDHIIFISNLNSSIHACNKLKRKTNCRQIHSLHHIIHLCPRVTMSQGSSFCCFLSLCQLLYECQIVLSVISEFKNIYYLYLTF